MRIVNDGLPEPVYQAILKDPYKKEGDYTATELVKAPQIVQLERRHDDEIVVNASSRLYALEGQAFHKVLEQAGVKHGITETRFGANFGKHYVTGQLDIYVSTTRTLIDYK